jgi:hypothetical protein
VSDPISFPDEHCAFQRNVSHAWALNSREVVFAASSAYRLVEVAQNALLGNFVHQPPDLGWPCGLLGIRIPFLKMRGGIWISVLAAVIAFLQGVEVVAQQPRPTMPPLQNPAILAGLWEASNEQGGIVGIQIILNTRGQDVETIEFGLFERTGSEFGDLPFNYFGPQGRGADTCHWDGHHLTIDFVPPQSKVKLTPERAAMSLVTPVHVDLIWNESVGTWTGLFQYESSEGHVVLRRPTPVVPNVADSLVGSWTSRDGLVNRCLHVVRESDGKLNGWVDSIPAPERIVCPSKMPPTPIMGHYGDMTKVELARDGKINTEFGAYSGMCCSQAFEARISLDGTLLEGGYLTGPNQTAVPATWRRVAGQSCSAENAKSPAP